MQIPCYHRAKFINLLQGSVLTRLLFDGGLVLGFRIWLLTKWPRIIYRSRNWSALLSYRALSEQHLDYQKNYFRQVQLSVG